jgi:tripartite-type tricarboxylate transporter receptor subunit TctC
VKHLDRRQVGALLSAAALALALPGPAFAQGAKTLRILVGYAPGGAADVVARAVGEGLRSGGYNVIVENKAGAGGRLSIESLLTLPPDGSTLLMTPLGNLTIYPHIYRSLRYDPLNDLVPVATASAMTFGIAVGASNPAKTLQEYLALAKKDPAMASYGTPGAGTQMHFLGVMLARESKVPLSHVPYKGGSAAVTDAIGGSLPAVITTLPNLLPMHRAGKLRILAISDTEPNAALPGVPTFKAAGFADLTMTEVFGFFARSGTPAAVVNDLSAAISAAVRSPAVAAVLNKVEFDPLVMTPAALDKQVRADYQAWAKVVKATGYTPEE